MWLFYALLARSILGSATIFDKLLLQKSYPNPVGYTFWIGMLSLCALALIPFGVYLLPVNVTGIAFLAGALFIAGTLFFYQALFRSEASNTALTVGILAPISTLVLSMLVLGTELRIYELQGFFLLLFAILALFLSEKREMRWAMLVLAFGAAFFGSFSIVLTKVVFTESNFATGFFWTKMGAALAALLFLCFKRGRKYIFHAEARHTSRHRGWYLLNRGFAASGSVFLYYAFSLGSPPLVDATTSISFVLIMIGGWLFLKEKFRGKVLFLKMLAIVLTSLAIFWIACGDLLVQSAPRENRPILWGVTFAPRYSQNLGLDWRANYEAILSELRPPVIRLIAYWDEIEPQAGVYQFEELDWQIARARDMGVKVVLAFGYKTPRWPECHPPQWTRSFSLEAREEELRRYISELVSHYRSEPAIIIWQVENEPYLAFGDCNERGKDFLAKEITVVKAMDPTRPVLTTDGGEFGRWVRAAWHGDMFGTTMYRKAFPSIIGPLFGVIEYPIPPEYFRIKTMITRAIIGDYEKPFIVGELQAEPWSPRALHETPYEEQLELFSPEYYRSVIQYAEESGFDTYYLWGVEWWWWMKIKFGNASYWDYSKELFQSSTKI